MDEEDDARGDGDEGHESLLPGAVSDTEGRVGAESVAEADRQQEEAHHRLYRERGEHWHCEREKTDHEHDAADPIEPLFTLSEIIF